MNNVNTEGLLWLAANGKLVYQTDEDYPDGPERFRPPYVITYGKDCSYRCLVLNWEPGDATSYKMVFTRLPEGQDAVPRTHWMVTDVNISRASMFLNGGNCVDRSYVREKLGTLSLDLSFRAQTIIINALLGDLDYAKALHAMGNY